VAQNKVLLRSFQRNITRRIVSLHLLQRSWLKLSGRILAPELICFWEP
jgi:hypothetical protein